MTFDIDPTLSSKWLTILFNCNCHTFDAVITQIIRAIHCPRNKAEDLAFFADMIGEVIICEGTKEKCEEVAVILGSIGLKATVIDQLLH